MTTHAEHVALHEAHKSVSTHDFASIEKYVIYLMHIFPYCRLSRIAGGKAVLDLGCNNGYGSNILSFGAERVVGVDVSAKFIADAQARFFDRPIEFALVDGERLPFADNAFDIVVSCQVIEHVIDTDRYLAEIARVLAPDGFAMFTTPNRCIRLDPGMAPWNRFHVTEFHAAELTSLLRRTFPSAAVRGLFASDPVYCVEAERVDAKRRRKRVRDFEKLAGAAVTAPSGAAALASRQYEDLETFMAAHGVGDLRWEGECLDAALDLMAVCARDPLTVGQALDALCAD